MSYGAIYIAHNPRNGENTFKVGMTERSVHERMKELTAVTSNIGQYSAVAYFIVSDAAAAEKSCHKRLDRYRVQENREFFELPLDRLLKMVREETGRFRATDFIPQDADVAIGETVTSTGTPEPLSVADRLAATREAHSNKDHAWDQALEDAEAKFDDVIEIVRTRALKLQKELEHEELLRCDIPDRIELSDARSNRPRLCTFSIYSRIESKPIVLRRSGLRGGIYGDLDLTRAIPESVQARQELFAEERDFEFVDWKEPDDGRLGYVSVFVELFNSSEHAKKENLGPSVTVNVNGARWRYDDHDQNFKEGGPGKLFTDPEEAMDVVTEIILKNLAVPQADVRTVSGVHKPRHGRSRRKIRDWGKFDLDALE